MVAKAGLHQLWGGVENRPFEALVTETMDVGRTALISTWKTCSTSSTVLVMIKVFWETSGTKSRAPRSTETLVQSRHISTICRRMWSAVGSWPKNAIPRPTQTQYPTIHSISQEHVPAFLVLRITHSVLLGFHYNTNLAHPT